MSYFDTLLFEDYWNIGIVEDNITHLMDNKNPEIIWFPKIKKDQFLADPFIVRDPKIRSLLHIFCEIFSYKNQKGRIGHITYDTQLNEFSDVQTVLEEAHHLAYPFIIENDGNIFMVPESSANFEVALYKATQFPTKWEKIKVLINDYPGVDNSIVFFKNIWWLFSTDMKKGQHSHLNIFYSEHLQGDWTPHPKNPVKKGKDTYRCAGTPFLSHSILFRPSMDCSHKYGEKIILNRVKKLTKETFEEEVVGKIEPYQNSSFKDKTHTISKEGDLAVVDGCKETFFCLNPYMIPYKIKTLLEKAMIRLADS